MSSVYLMSKGHVTETIEFIVKDKVENKRVDYNDKLHYLDCCWFEKTEGEKRDYSSLYL
jgi:hypothetical protein